MCLCDFGAAVVLPQQSPGRKMSWTAWIRVGETQERNKSINWLLFRTQKPCDERQTASQANIISAFFTPSSLHQFLALIACICYTYKHISSFCNSFTAPQPGCGDTAVTQAHSQADTWHWATALTHGLTLAFLHPSHMIPPSLFTHLLPFLPFSFSASIFTTSQVFPCFLSSISFLASLMIALVACLFLYVLFSYIILSLFSMVWLELYFIVSSLILVSTLILIWFRLLFPSLSSFLFFNYLSALLLSGSKIHK